MLSLLIVCVLVASFILYVCVMHVAFGQLKKTMGSVEKLHLLKCAKKDVTHNGHFWDVCGMLVPLRRSSDVNDVPSHQRVVQDPSMDCCTGFNE